MSVRKICIRCGVDCSTMKRVKDAQGNYVCGPCAESLAAARAVAGKLNAPKSPAPSPTSSPTSSPSSTPKPQANPADDLVDLAAEDPKTSPLPSAESELALAPIDPTTIVSVAPCPSCARALPGDAQICTHCGYDKRKGFSKPGGTCKNCGYSTEGLKEPVCPECGERLDPVLAKSYRDALREESIRVEADQWRKPLIHTAIAVAAMLVIALIRWGVGGPSLFRTFVPSVIGIAVAWPFAVGAYWLAAIIWMGFDEAMQYVAVKLAGALFVAAAITLVMTSLTGTLAGFGFVQLAVWVVVVISLDLYLHLELDLDWGDATILGSVLSIIFFIGQFIGLVIARLL